MTAEGIALIRTASLGVTGLCCLAYSAMALVTGRPDPVGWYVPGAVGLSAALLITIAALMGGKSAAGAATDELYRAVNHRAERQAYWLSMALFAVIAVSCSAQWVPWPAGMAVLGCMMGASYLLLFVWHDLRMR